MSLGWETARYSQVALPKIRSVGFSFQREVIGKGVPSVVKILNSGTGVPSAGESGSRFLCKPIAISKESTGLPANSSRGGDGSVGSGAETGGAVSGGEQEEALNKKR